MTAKTLLRSAALVALTAGILLVGKAQAFEDNVLIAHVPFAFLVDGHTFPAGTYRVVVGPDMTEPPLVTIQSADFTNGKSDHFINVETTPASSLEAQGASRLVFQKEGSRTVLEEVVPAEGPARFIH